MTTKRFNQITERITKKITAFLDKGIIPWQQPWVGGFANRPRSVSSNKVYRGVNLALLSCAGFTSPWWMTFHQATKLGGTVKKGSASLPVCYWKFHDKEDCKKCDGSKPDCWFCKGTGKYTPYPTLFSFNVFNAEQVEGLPAKYYETIEDEKGCEFNPIEKSEEIVSNYKNAPEISHDQSHKNFYRKSSDEIHLTPEDSFISPEECYSVKFHEMIHSTGHEDRLDRESLTDAHFFGDTEYSKEELVAEMGSAFLCGLSGIATKEVIKNSAAYLQGWKSKLEENTDWIVWAGSQAQKGVDHILGTEYSDDNTKGDK